MKHHLQQQIAEFFFQIFNVAALNRIGHLIGFFQRIGCDGGEILLQIPRATGFRTAKGGHY